MAFEPSASVKHSSQASCANVSACIVSHLGTSFQPLVSSTWIYTDQVPFYCVTTESSVHQHTHVLCFRRSAHGLISITLLVAAEACFCAGTSLRQVRTEYITILFVLLCQSLGHGTVQSLNIADLGVISRQCLNLSMTCLHACQVFNNMLLLSVLS